MYRKCNSVGDHLCSHVRVVLIFEFSPSLCQVQIPIATNHHNVPIYTMSWAEPCRTDLGYTPRIYTGESFIGMEQTFRDIASSLDFSVGTAYNIFSCVRRQERLILNRGSVQGLMSLTGLLQ